jgi:tungstate transport system substrate-binding protein
MKKILTVFCAIVMVLSLAACGTDKPAPTPVPAPAPPAASSAAPAPAPSSQPPAAPLNKRLRLSTTTSVNDSGLLPYLQKEFEKDTGFELEVTSAGTGAAIEKGRTGDADCLLVHAKSSEESFIGEGFGEERVPFMFNFFVIVGPPDDPAGVAECEDTSQAFKIFADKGFEFVSRGDKSGTHVAEMNIWKAAGIEPEGKDWYVSTGQGMGASLNIASEKGAYIMTDKATYLSHALRDTMKILLEKSDEMKNTYSMIAISPKRFDDTNADAAKAFIEWMTSDKASEMIDDYGIAEYKEQLFYVIK